MVPAGVLIDAIAGALPEVVTARADNATVVTPAEANSSAVSPSMRPPGAQ